MLKKDKLLLKRVFDTIITLIALPIILPVFFLVSFLVWLNIGRPIFFKQIRPGLYGKPFSLIKFRTMTNERNSLGHLLPDNERLGKFGILLRKSSLDELPEIWNIFCGDMSFVGPRPLLMQYLNLYSKEQMKRHDVRPGLTGLAQINGRNSLDWESKFKLDCYYVENLSFKLDIKIIIKTIIVVIKSDNISMSNHATMQEFTGNKADK